MRWLRQHLPTPFVGPFHRRNDDLRPDAEVKADLYQSVIGSYDVKAAIDDNPSVVTIWRRLGIPVEVVAA